MTPALERKSALSIAASLVIVLVGLRLAAPVVIPVLLAFTLVVAVRPLTRWLESSGVPPRPATAASVVVVLLILVALGALLVLAATELSEAAPRLQSSARELRSEFITWTAQNGIEKLGQSVKQLDFHERALATAMGGVRGLAGLVTTLFAVLVFAIFMLIEASGSGSKLDLLATGSGRDKSDWLRVLRDLQRYLIAKTAMSALTGLLVGILTLSFGIEGAVLWGVIAFVLNYIPIVGSIIAGVPAIILALVDGGFVTGGLVTSGYLVINVGVSNFLEPRVMGETLGLSPLVVLFSVLLWGFILGPVGALLSVPLTMGAKIGMERSERYGWISRLMEPGVRPPD